MTGLRLDLLRLIVALLVPFFAGGCRNAGEFPSQPVTLICPWSAGGGTDRVSRQVAVLLEGELGVPVNVVNATGGSGVTGHTRGASARPDGHTITMITVELNMLHWRGLTPITHEAFAPLMLLNRDPAALFVWKDSPIGTLEELESAVRARPGGLKASGTAQGGIWHVALAGWLHHRGVGAGDANWISINGAGPSLQELAAGGLDFVCCSLPEADAMLAGGQVRCLGVMSGERLPGYPEVPTFREQGHDWTMAGWRGLAAPAGTPPDRLEILGAALGRVVGSPGYLEFMATAGFNVSIEPAESFATTLAEEDGLFRDILRSEAFAGVSEEYFGLMVFPLLVGGLLALTIILCFSLCPIPGSEALPGGRSFWSANSWFVLGASVFFLLAAEGLGFVVTAGLVLGGLLLRFGLPWRPAIGTAAAASVLAYQVFSVLLRVPLPRGLISW